MIMLEQIDKPMSFSNEECSDLTESLQNKWDHFTIEDLGDYVYNIDTELETITFNLSQLSEVENNSWMNYEDYKLIITQSDGIQDRGFYYFFISSCNSSEQMSFSIEYTMLNPGNEHLSYDLIPNKITYFVFLILWIIGFGLTTVDIIFKKVKNHKLFSFNLLINLSFFALMLYWTTQYAYWMNLSRTGKETVIISLMILFFEILTLWYYLIILLIIANGYKIVYDEFRWKSSGKVLILIGFILMTNLLMKYSNFYLMIILLVEIIILVLLLKMDINSNVTKLK